MSNYTKATDFAAKDALLTGNPAKIIKGTELNDEFNSIQTAVATKADLASPAFTGSPTATTQAVNNNSTRLATTAYTLAAIANNVYPIGSIYLNATNSTNPGTLLGFGTWVAFGAGRMPVGFDSGDSLFDSAEETGGSKNAVVVSHSHGVTDPGHQHVYNARSGGGVGQAVGTGSGVVATFTDSAVTGISINSSGVTGTNANLPPYITVYMWKRTA